MARYPGTSWSIAVNAEKEGCYCKVCLVALKCSLKTLLLKNCALLDQARDHLFNAHVKLTEKLTLLTH